MRYSGAARGYPDAKGRRATITVLFYKIGADLADRRVLIAGTAAATHRADQLAVLDRGNPPGLATSVGSSVPT